MIEKTCKLEYYLRNILGEDTKEIILEVRDNNEEGLKFYQDNGFKIIRTINNYYKDGDAYIMERIRTFEEQEVRIDALQNQQKSLPAIQQWAEEGGERYAACSV